MIEEIIMGYNVKAEMTGIYNILRMGVRYERFVMMTE